jgi:DNA-binding MarR family transcriptional regulator
MQPEEINNAQNFANVVHKLVATMAKNNQVYEEACKTYFGVTSSQGGTILALPLENTLKMNELSNISGVDTSTMTRMIDQLVEKGLVIRQPGENDRRQVHIGLTAEGFRLHRELAAALDKFYQDSLDRIPEKERAVIVKSLEKVNEAISIGLEECCKRYSKH